jgi:hypothetical protein
MFHLGLFFFYSAFSTNQKISIKNRSASACKFFQHLLKLGQPMKSDTHLGFAVSSIVNRTVPRNYIRFLLLLHFLIFFYFVFLYRSNTYYLWFLLDASFIIYVKKNVQQESKTLYDFKIKDHSHQ